MPRRECIAACAFFISCAIGCEEKKPPPDPVAPPTASVPIALDAGLLGEPSDPPAPAGDLAADLERFVNVDTCVAERAKLDPLVGDALGAIGYETFLRDACRLLAAAKDRRRQTCDTIDSSALRSRCQTWVATIAQAPDGCPMQFEGLVTRGRNASCVAIAARDPRLCAGESRTVQRATCEAMVARDPAKCDGLLPSQRALCQREVARWRSVLGAQLEGLDKLPAARGKLVIKGASGTPDPPASEVDLSSDFVRGVVVVTAREGRGGDRMRVELGTVAESEAARIAASPQKRARVGLAVILEPPPRSGDKDKDKAQATLQKLEIELPGEPPLVSPPASCECKLTTARVASARGGEAAIALEGVIASGGRTYNVAIDLATFVRDVVGEGEGGAGTRVLPPLHPALPLLGARDGGVRPR